MKIAILSDLHANYEATKLVLESVEKQNVDKIFVLGDIVGYNFDIKKVIEELKKYKDKMEIIKGNHEQMLEDLFLKSIPYDKSKYGNALEKTINEIDTKEIISLCSLPEEIYFRIDSLNILLTHGIPGDNQKYIYPDHPNSELSEFNFGDANLVCLGNTHHQMLRRIGEKTIINPGSVGQNRSNPSKAEWATIDSTTEEITFHSIRMK